MAKVRLDKNFKGAIDKIKSNSQQSAVEIGEMMKDEVSRRAPVDTGELRDSVGYNIDGGRVDIGAGADYAAAVEFGTSRARAQPFLGNTANENIVKMKSIAKRNLSKM